MAVVMRPIYWEAEDDDPNVKAEIEGFREWTVAAHARAVAECFFCSERIEEYPYVNHMGTKLHIIGLHPMCAKTLGGILYADGQVACNPIEYGAMFREPKPDASA